MKPVSTSYLDSGRMNQKQRTRDHLLAAARTLIERRRHPPRRGRRARVRHLPDHRLPLLPHAGGAVGRRVPRDRGGVAAPRPRAGRRGSPGRRGRHGDHRGRRTHRTPAARHAPTVARTDEHELPLRQGRAIGWLREALEPLGEDVGDDAVTDLAVALRSVCGIETRVWLGDIAAPGPRRHPRSPAVDGPGAAGTCRRGAAAGDRRHAACAPDPRQRHTNRAVEPTIRMTSRPVAARSRRRRRRMRA